MHNSPHWNDSKKKERKAMEIKPPKRINWYHAYLKRPASHRYTKYADYIAMLKRVMG